jgi:hypothetical protein
MGLILAVPAVARALSLTPADADATTTGAANCEPTCVNTAFGTTFVADDLLYKANQDGSADGGSFADSYTTVFSNTPADPEDATISWDGDPDPSIICPACYLAVKDGNQDPSYYFFDISSWDGVEDIVLTGFWPNGGAISHVSIWGAPEDGEENGGEENGGGVPEPGTIALFGVGLAAVAARLRTRTATVH